MRVLLDNALCIKLFFNKSIYKYESIANSITNKLLIYCPVN